jgi:signal transduction histidine kinase
MAKDLTWQKHESDMFVYSVSHDLRLPLVNLKAFSEELGLSCRDLQGLLDRKEVPATLPHDELERIMRDIEASIGFIRTAVGRLSRIIDALLRLSHAGRVEYLWQSIDVAAVVRSIVDALRDSISERHAEIELCELPPTWGDPTTVELIFANLIGNAVQYLDSTRPGRIEVGCTTPIVPGKRAGLQVYFVKDNGLGIPELDHERLFTAFQRFHPDVAQGEGIGLALVRRMVQRHGGRIWLESAAGTGSTFFVALPACSGTSGGKEDVPPPPLHKPRGDLPAWLPSRS